LAVAKRETRQQWEDVAELYDVANRNQRIRGLRDGQKIRWRLNEVCVSLSRRTGMKEKTGFVLGISASELIISFIDDFLGYETNDETKRAITRSRGRHRTFTTPHCYIWSSQIKRRYACYLREESHDEQYKKCQKALKVKWLTKPRSYRMYNEHNPGGT